MNESAFPNTVTSDDPDKICIASGLTKRDYFAIHILSAIIGSVKGAIPEDEIERTAADMAELAVTFADSLIEKLAKK